VTDSCTRFLFAFPLLSVTAKAECDCLLQIFALDGVSQVITSDQGTCFTSQLTQEFIKLFGCSPRFSTALHPEGNSLVERLNQIVKKMLHHVCQKNPRKWHKVLPLVLWTIRESKHEALEDSGAEVGMVNTGLIRHLNLPVLGKIIIRPVVGKTVEADLVLLKIKPYAAQPYTNIAPYVEVIFAACELATDVNLILCGSVVKQLNKLKA